MKNISVALAVLLCLQCVAQTPPKREHRAAWIATYANIDWPSSGSTSAQEQSTFIQRVDEHKTTGMNAVYVQIRSQCDAMYPSSIEPWSADLTGTQGTAPNPYYDPLEFMITETRKRGMEFHAWLNPYRALANATTGNLAALHSTHVINQHPDWIMSAGSQRILNPGNPQVWSYVIGVVMDVVRRYDIDGIHFDDYFYPYPSAGTYNDDNEYNLYGRGIATKAEWRRSNVDSLIRRLGDSIKTVKPWVKFGISPSGIWLSLANDAVNGSNTSSGAIQHYKDLYANSRLWLQQGWIDYLAPQIYWYIGQTGSDYNILAPWWNNNAFGRHIYSGMAGYKVGDAAQNAAFATYNSQVPDQVRLNRQQANVKGQAIYNTTSLRNNKLGFRDSLQQFFYNKPALQPTMLWKDNLEPLPATSLVATQPSVGSIELNWIKPTIASNELDKVKRFAIYRSTTFPVDIANTNNLLFITWNDTTKYTDNTVAQNTAYYYVVTALDRLHNESAASNTATIVSLPLQLIRFTARAEGSGMATLQFTTVNEYNVSHFEVEKSTDAKTFNTLVKLAATNGQQTNNYSCTDNLSNNKGSVFYRIKMVDKDHKHSYSTIAMIDWNSRPSMIKVFPTVIAKGSASLNITGLETKAFNFQVINETGLVIQKGSIAVQNIGQVYELKLNASYPAGLYYINIKTGDGKPISLPFVIQ